MDRTPNLRVEILDIPGNAEAIAERGADIESLGHQMTAAAGVLDDIELGAETRGKSLDTIKDVVGDTADDLRTAGDRYLPSGTAIRRYGEALATAQERLRTLMPELQELWTAYTTAQTQYEQDSQLPDPEPGESDAGRTTAGDVSGARGEWETKAVEYEGVYDAWWTAYDDARKDIEDANDDGVKDNWVDNNLDLINFLLDVLSYAGIALAILACIFGGPFILLGALVGLAALALTVAKVAGGHGGALDIVMAAVGVFPFGKFAGVFKGAGKLASLKGMAGDIFGAGFRNGSRVSSVLSRGPLGQVFHAGGKVNRNGTAVMRNFFDGLESPSVLSRLLRGNEGATTAMLQDAASGLSNKATNNLSQFLGSTPGGNVVQSMLDGPASSAAMDFLDNLGKAGAGFAYDRGQGGLGFGL